jgi:hypothetical protein
MNRGRRRNLKAGVILAGIAIAVLYVAAAGYAQHGMQHGQGGPQQGAGEAKRPAEGLDVIHSTQLPAAQKTLERAIQHLEAGRQQEALRELQQAKVSLEAVRVALGRHIEPSIVNDRCPIMGSRINPTAVPAHLTRMHEGRKVAFCCAGCPEAWDQLDDAQKAAKLTSVTPGPQRGRVQPRTAPATPAGKPAQALSGQPRFVGSPVG